METVAGAWRLIRRAPRLSFAWCRQRLLCAGEVGSCFQHLEGSENWCDRGESGLASLWQHAVRELHGLVRDSPLKTPQEPTAWICVVRAFPWRSFGDRSSFVALVPVYPPRSSERQGGPSVDPDLRDARAADARAQLDVLEG